MSGWVGLYWYSSRYYPMVLQLQNTLALEVNKQRNTVWARKAVKKKCQLITCRRSSCSWARFCFIRSIRLCFSIFKTCYKKTNISLNHFLRFNFMSVLPPHHVYLASLEARRPHWIPWSYRWFWATLWVSGTQTWSSASAATALRPWASPQPPTNL